MLKGPKANSFYFLPEIKPLLQQVLNSMSCYVNLPAVIQIILQDPAYSGGTFGEIRDLMMGLSQKIYTELILLVSLSMSFFCYRYVRQLLV